MKIGCFIKTSAIIVIIIGISFYLYKKYGNQVINVGKEKVEEFISEKIQNSIDEIKESIKKEAIQKSFEELLADVQKKELVITNDEYEKIINQISELVDSNKISIENLQKIEKLLEPYERRKKK